MWGSCEAEVDVKAPSSGVVRSRLILNYDKTACWTSKAETAMHGCEVVRRGENRTSRDSVWQYAGEALGNLILSRRAIALRLRRVGGGGKMSATDCGDLIGRAVTSQRHGIARVEHSTKCSKCWGFFAVKRGTSNPRQQSDGLEESGEDGQELVCCLHSALCGLRQCSRQRHGRMHTRLFEKSFANRTASPCVYIQNEGATVLLLYVDGILVAESDK